MGWFDKKTWANGTSPALNATNLNSNEAGIIDGIYGIGLPFTSNTEMDFTYTADDLIDTAIGRDTDGTTQRVKYDFSYTGSEIDDLVVTVYEDDGSTVTTTKTYSFTYTAGLLTNITTD